MIIWQTAGIVVATKEITADIAFVDLMTIRHKSFIRQIPKRCNQ